MPMLGSLLAPHSLFHHPYNDHQDASAGSTCGDLLDDRTNVEPARSGGATTVCSEQRAKDLRANTTADHANKAVADNSEVKLLQHRPGNVSSCCPADELDDQANYAAPHDESSPAGSPHISPNTPSFTC